MKFTRKATAIWHKDLKSGSGSISTESRVLDATPYAFKTRFENGNPGTNPEELLGAAHAACFTMQLSALLAEQGFVAGELHTDAAVSFEDGSISLIVLSVRAQVSDIEAQVFESIAQKAKEVCPLSKALKAVAIELNATLV